MSAGSPAVKIKQANSLKLTESLKREHLTPIMSAGRNVSGQSSPHLASSIDTLYMSVPLEERHERAFLQIPPW